MREFKFRLNIPASEILAYYHGEVSKVIVTCFNGQSVQFPVHALRPYVTHHGVTGTFVMRLSPENKLLGLEKITDAAQ